MDVTCERCGTEYEFDDALVSGRGTTVKCTNCGFQFKVRRPDGGGTESWVVRTVDGREIEFAALRELQQAIARAKITKDDVLAREGARPRRLGSIAELDPFFAAAVAPVLGVTVSGLGREPLRTPMGGILSGGSGPPRFEGSVAFTLPTAAVPQAEVEPTPSPAPGRRAPSIPPPLPKGLAMPSPAPRDAPAVRTLPGIVVPPESAPPLPGPLPPPNPPPPRAASTSTPPPARTSSPPSTTGEGGEAPASPFSERKNTLIGVGSSEPPPAPAAGSSGRAPARSAPPGATPTPTDVRSSLEGRYGSDSRASGDESRTSFDEAYAEPRFSSPIASRRAGTRWIAGLVLVGVGVLGALTFGRRLLAGPPHAPAAVVSDERVALLLHQGEQSLLEGDLDASKESLDKASVLVDADPRVAIGLARLAVVRADTRWLATRLLAADDPDLPAAKRVLEQSAGGARAAADRAVALAPAEPAAVRARLDALRIGGDLDGARRLVGALGPAASQPESALSLAALDLAEDDPSLVGVIERLRAAAAAEQGLGRARALLTYALARSGDLSSARAELDHLAALPRPHPLMQALRAFVARAEKGKAEAKGGDVMDKDKAKAETAPAASSANRPPGERPPGKRAGGGRSGGSWISTDRVPDDYVAPAQGVPVDTSDLPGAESKKPAPAPPPPAPPPIDTSDLPGAKP